MTEEDRTLEDCPIPPEYRHLPPSPCSRVSVTVTVQIQVSNRRLPPSPCSPKQTERIVFFTIRSNLHFKAEFTSRVFFKVLAKKKLSLNPQRWPLLVQKNYPIVPSRHIQLGGTLFHAPSVVDAGFPWGWHHPWEGGANILFDHFSPKVWKWRNFGVACPFCPLDLPMTISLFGLGPFLESNVHLAQSARLQK